MNFKIYFLLFIIYSFLGWIIEVIDIYYEQKKLLNRGFLIGPICPIYGVGCLLMIFLLQKYMDEPIALFVLSIVICSILEYMTSLILEKIFKVRWWDYSNKKFNINGRICLETMLPFGIMGTLMCYYINPFFNHILKSLNPIILNVSFYVSALIFLIDLIVSLKIITNIKIITSNVIKDNTEDIKKSVKESLKEKIRSWNIFKSKKAPLNEEIEEALVKKSYFTKRFVKSFPGFKVNGKFKDRKKE